MEKQKDKEILRVGNIVKGGVTLPGQEDMEDDIKNLLQSIGADAVRDSDGTILAPEFVQPGTKIYSTLCLIRADNQWAKKNKNKTQQNFLMSNPVTAVSSTLRIRLLEDYFEDEYEVDTTHDPKQWWEVIDRTTSDIISADLWDFDPAEGAVIIPKAKKWHVYTVNFMAWHIWDSTTILNYIINNWTGDHLRPLDPRHPEVRHHLLNYLKAWLKDHPNTDVVRFTSFLYHFTKVMKTGTQSRYYDWGGYCDTVSIPALRQFKQEKGYCLSSEDIVNKGYYNNGNCVPTRKYLDWIDFQQKFVCEVSREWVSLVHGAGKEAMLFLGDHWIGAEPYGPYFNSIGLDAVVAAARSAVHARMVADIPAAITKELRLFPYFFEDLMRTSDEEPEDISRNTWNKVRRGILQNPVDRIGWGGYLNVAVKYPKLVDSMVTVAKEFREILQKTGKQQPQRASFGVAILNSWGELRRWMNHKLWYEKYRCDDINECLAGMPFDMRFISFEDIISEGIPDDIGVIINAGQVGTAWSGGDNWKDERVVSAVREWVYGGGGFIGVQEPTACEFQGRFFQLDDILGVQKETGLSKNSAVIYGSDEKDHFIFYDQDKEFDPGLQLSFVYPSRPTTKVLARKGDHITCACNSFGKGRSVYFADLPYSSQNTRLLLRALHWTAGCENKLSVWLSSNVFTECYAYPDSGYFCVVNNSLQDQVTTVTTTNGDDIKIVLKAGDIIWKQI